MERKQFTVPAAVCTIIVTFSILITISVIFPHDMVRMNGIQPNVTYLDAPPVPVSHSFNFQNDTITVSMLINRSVYEGAKETDKRVFTFAGVPYATWAGESARKMIEDPVLDEFYHDLLFQFRTIREEKNLTDDEYAELLASYAQSFRYETKGLPAKFPVETVSDGYGDCDDFSFLLAGLLSREGYKTALFFFESDNHVVAGIGSNENQYLDTEYAYVDIMDYSFIGVTVNELKGSDSMYLDPIVIPVGSGMKIYHSGNETRNIADIARLAYHRSGDLSARMKEMRQDPAFNLAEYDRIAGESSQYSRIYTYIIRHRFDRPGTYAYLQREMGFS